MASTIDLSGLEHYINTLEKCKVLLKNFYKAMEMLCQEAQRYAEQEYSQYGRTDITVGYDNNGKRTGVSKPMPLGGYFHYDMNNIQTGYSSAAPMGGYFHYTVDGVQTGFSAKAPGGGFFHHDLD